MSPLLHTNESRDKETPLFGKWSLGFPTDDVILKACKGLSQFERWSSLRQKYAWISLWKSFFCYVLGHLSDRTTDRYERLVPSHNGLACDDRTWNYLNTGSALQWRHNERDGVSTHQPQDRLLNRLFRCRSNKTSKLRVTGLCDGNSPLTGEFPARRANNAEKVYIWWGHHVYHLLDMITYIPSQWLAFQTNPNIQKEQLLRCDLVREVQI